MVLLMSIRIQAFELSSGLVAFLAKKEVITVLTHPALLLDLSLAIKTLVTLVFEYLRLKYHLQLMICLMPLHQTSERRSRSFEIALLT